MKYKKKEKKILQEKLSEYLKHQIDHEQFLSAFERPTQIYRYLRLRQVSSPVFLHRNLSYMQCRLSREKNTRSKRGLNKVVEQLSSKTKPHQDSVPPDLLLEIKGINGIGQEAIQNATLEIYSVRAAQKRKQTMRRDALESKIGEVTIPCNPKSSQKPVSVHLEGDLLNFSQDLSARVPKLLLRVSGSSKVGDSVGNNALTNGYSTSNTQSESEDDSSDGPATKRRKTRSHNKSQSTSTSKTKEESFECDSELALFDDINGNLLASGHYEIVLYDTDTEKSESKQQWCTVEQEEKSFATFESNPVLEFEIKWSKETRSERQQAAPKSPGSKSKSGDKKSDKLTSSYLTRQQQKPQHVFYHFLFANKTRQQTEARPDMHCPWCFLGCCQLYSLLKHLRNCHARFNFTYMELPKSVAKINVSINESYDGSYVGNPLDLQAHIGYCFGRHGPVRRAPVTQLIVYKPKKPSFELSEFIEPELEIPRYVIYGHNRLYNHSVTLTPLRPSEMDCDSEDELDPEWLRQKTSNLIEEFTDVNEGEKEIMKMWNIHVMHLNVLGACQVARACTLFVQEYGAEVVQRQLCHNFMLHLVNLYDNALIRREVLVDCVRKLQRLRSKMYADGLLSRAVPVPVNKKWEPLRNCTTIPIITSDSPTFVKLVQA